MGQHKYLMLIFGIHQIIGRKPKSLIEVAKMVSEGRNQVSTATTNLLSFSQWSNKTNIQIFKITIQLVCQRPYWQISAVYMKLGWPHF